MTAPGSPSDALGPGRRAFVLAAGRSTRLLPLTSRVAKPALPFVGRAILDRVLDGLADAGVVEAIVNLHHAPQSIRETIARRGERPPRVTFSEEPREILGTGGALVPVAPRLRDGGAFFLVNGDCVHSIDYGALLAEHVASGAAATLVARSHGVPGFGSLQVDASGVVEAFSVPTRGEPDERHFLSVQVVSPDLLDTLPTGGPASFSSFAAWYPAARAGGRVFRVLETDAEWHAMDTPGLYLAATHDFLARRDAGPHVAPGAIVDDTAWLDVASVVHEGCTVGPRARLEGTVLMPGAVIEEGARLANCLVGFGERVPSGTEARDALLADAST